MTFKNDLKMLKRKKLLRDILKHQKEPPENSLYGASLRELLHGVTCTTERRKLMRMWFLQLSPYGGYMRLPVNKHYYWNTKDKDLQHLLSVGFLKIVRDGIKNRINEQTRRKKYSGARCSYLVYTGGK